MIVIIGPTLFACKKMRASLEPGLQQQAIALVADKLGPLHCSRIGPMGSYIVLVYDRVDTLDEYQKDLMIAVQAKAVLQGARLLPFPVPERGLDPG